ncbi:MAG: pitrilysin family protein [bacterium]
MRETFFGAACLMLAAVMAACAAAQDKNGNEGFLKMDNVTKRVLDNGMTVLVREDHAAPVATVNVWVKTGYFNEPDEWTGISHMLEHMFFKGTETRPVGKIQDEVKSYGGYWNAGTIYDHTNYYIVLPSSEITRALDIEADALINSTFDPAELDKEHEVVIQEILQKFDRPDAMVWEKMMALAYRKHHIGRWRMGLPEQVRAMDRDVIVEYYKNNYRPENIVLVVVGDVDTAAVTADVERLFGPMPRGELKRTVSPPEPAQDGLRYGQETSDITQAYLAAGFHAPPALHDDEQAVEILAYLLGDGKSSRLYRELKERRKLVNAISTGYYSMEGVGTFYIEAELPVENLRAAEEAIFVEMERVGRRPPSAFEMEKIKSAIEYGFLSSMEEVSGQANRLAAFEALGDYRLLVEYLEKLRAVTAGDVQRAAEKYLNVRNCTIREYRPEGKGDGTTDGQLERAIGEAVGKADFGASLSEAAPEVPAVGSAVGSKEDGPVAEHKLSNGIRVIVRGRRRLPLVSMGVYFEGGRLWDTPDTAGLTTLTLRSSMKGTATRTAERIQDELAALGARAATGAPPDYSAYRLSVLSRNLPAAVDVLADIVLNPSFPEEEIEKEREFQMAEIKRGMDSMYYYPQQLARRAAYGGHPYGLPADGYDESVKALSREQIVQRHKELINAEGALIVVVGDVDGDSLMKLLEEKFGGIPTGTAAQRTSAPPLAFGPEILAGTDVVERKKSQSAQAFTFAAAPAESEDTVALNILRNIASGMGGRLYDEVREKNNLAYAVIASLELNRYGGVIMNYAATSPENEEKARAMMLDVWKKMAGGDISAEEFENARRYTKGIHQISLQVNSYLRDQYARNRFMGRGLDYIERFPAMVDAATLERVREAAAEYAAPGAFALGVVRATGD